MANWLAKSEPDEFSLDDLAARGEAGEPWNGIRNYQARNHLRAMQPGDRVLIYHSACAEPAVMGEAEVISEPYPDPDALNPESRYFDPKSSADNPRWTVVKLAFRKRWPAPVPLKQIKQTPELAEMALLRQSRLSVSPVTDAQWAVLERLSNQSASR
ncbi:EVE domain-containing protein [Saccharospirillum mangrovi]|uniref:EVE domain-containing protein n=1 Tax=Saccharospirillum mangrovi TaxID=2161747 RepID=UPI000D39F125|nr:EVE domain-containing protein [Saccharospirillum mangrovi]